MPNRLAAETSPYLLQHKDNPVDWFPWGEEAFAKAQLEDKPIFLSVGYSSCHWCHVMAHESFESQEVARVLNESYVCVKVDREERPDVDEAYMTAVQLSSGRGGWPMSVFMTPNKKPFFAGTYFPLKDRGQHPGFLNICAQIAAIWKSKRAELEDNATEFALGLAEAIGRPAPVTSAVLDEEFVAKAVRSLAAGFDAENGGFGGAPKFPPHTSIDFLLRYSQRETAPGDLREIALAMALLTLEKMALGGINDHAGGGFHRYSTDTEWHLPHFEKMLYDNALMVANYSLATKLLGDGELSELFRKTVLRTVAWMENELLQSQGNGIEVYCSALDADSEGEEGKYYTWSVNEMRAVVPARFDEVADTFDIRREGNFHDEASGRLTGENVLHRRKPLPVGGLDRELEALNEHRKTRVKPELDTKALIAWNGLAIIGLTEMGIPSLVERAAAIAKHFLDVEARSSELPHQISRGKPGGPTFLEDFTSFALGLFRIASSVEEPRSEWFRDNGRRLTHKMIDLFWDEDQGGFFSTSKSHEQLFGRSKPVFDSPTPSGNAIALQCLIEIGDLERAEKLVATFLGWMEQAPQATEALLAAALPLVRPNSTGVAPRTRQVTVRLESEKISVGTDNIGKTILVISIPDGFHINSNAPVARWLIPTKVSVEPLHAEIDYPSSELGDYAGEVHIPMAIRLPSEAGSAEVEITVSYQCCTDTECLAPAEKKLAALLRR